MDKPATFPSRRVAPLTLLLSFLPEINNNHVVLDQRVVNNDWIAHVRPCVRSLSGWVTIWPPWVLPARWMRHFRSHEITPSVCTPWEGRACSCTVRVAQVRCFFAPISSVTFEGGGTRVKLSGSDRVWLSPPAVHVMSRKMALSLVNMI